MRDYGRKENLEGIGTLRTKIKIVVEDQALVFTKMRIKDFDGNKLGSTGWTPLFATSLEGVTALEEALKALGFEFYAETVVQPVEVEG